MGKAKTKKSIASRFRTTAKGKLKRFRPGRRHILTKKSGNKKRALRTPAIVSKAHTKKYKILMGG